ncbi:hypothetical protein ACHHYP_13162 [Achlya hypogyna]|uniref:Transmembrane protein 267 n=1 Tax=Achlya hypogyna TaxID=1202772 RepID=A0A1V9ZFX0_ACHHY|nr:hypothetical protein ACHHYP_13162 [Achlya hypogyna]
MLAATACADTRHVLETLALVSHGAAANAVLVLLPLYSQYRTRPSRAVRPWPALVHPAGLSTQLVVICMLADDVLHRRTCWQQARIFYGLVDNATHATVALLAWALACLYAYPFQRLQLLEGVIALLIGSLLDLDHFVAAAGWTFQAATSLSERPLGHAVAFIAAIALVVWCACPRSRRIRAVALVLVCLLSHQLRDAFRRGLWIAPGVGSTPPLPYAMYLALELSLPWVLARWWRWMEPAPPRRARREEPAIVV